MRPARAASALSPRLLRRILLVAAAVAILIVAMCAPAFAWEHPTEMTYDEGGASPAPALPAPLAAEAPLASPPASPVAASPGAGPSRRALREPESAWYGWQTLVADGSTLLGFPPLVLAVGGGEGLLVAGMLGSYLLASPIIHLGHGRVGTAFASLGLRVGAPLTLAFVGASAASDCGGYLCSGAGGLGLVLGVLAASAIDTAALAWEPAPERRDAQRGVAWSPYGAPRKEGGFDAGLGGTF